MTEGGAVEAATITAVYEAVLEHHQDHRHDIPSTHASALDCPTILHALQAAQEEAEAKVARLREALQQAEKIIRTWHGMAMNPDEEERVWRIYRDRSPEMKIIRQALSDEGRTEEVTR
jgi:hypothetical protein